MQTNIIKHNFNKASLSYDAAATVQYNAANHLVANLIKNFSEFYPKSILDLGTGTGYIPELLLNYFPKSQYILNDISENMLNKTKQKLNNYTNIKFNLNDMETTDFGFNQLIISNMALQWVKNLNNLLIKLFNNSNILAFSCLLNQTFDEWNYILKNLNLPIITHNYPKQSNLEKYLLTFRPKNYFFDTKSFVLEFNNALDFMKYLKNIGANTGSQKLSMGNLKNLLKYNNKFTVTYKIFFAILENQKIIYEI